jgi:15-cis-phytoene synthase
MNMDFYQQTCHDISRLLTNRYSTSFSLGIRVFAREYQQAIYAIYGFVRLSDEIVDTFHAFDKKMLLASFRQDVSDAIQQGISLNPVLQAFQETVHRYSLKQEYIDAFLNSMEMDLTCFRHDEESYRQYIYGSAEVVGLMCLQVFCSDHPGLFEQLEVPAKKLGSAFQKVNFLRDIKNDLEVRKRIYLPGIKNKEEINALAKRKIEGEIEKEFQAALAGIKKLPGSVRFAVYSVYLYYGDLFKRLKNCEVKRLLTERIRISNMRKICLLVKAFIEIQGKLLK